MKMALAPYKIHRIGESRKGGKGGICFTMFYTVFSLFCKLFTRYHTTATLVTLHLVYGQQFVSRSWAPDDEMPITSDVYKTIKSPSIINRRLVEITSRYHHHRQSFCLLHILYIIRILRILLSTIYIIVILI